MSKQKSSSKKVPPDIGLHMECVEEELDPAQQAFYKKAEKEFDEVQAKIDMYVNQMKAEVVEKNEHSIALHMNITPQASAAIQAHTKRVAASPHITPNILQRAPNSQDNTYLLMDSRFGLVVSQPPPGPVVTVKSVTSRPGRSTKQSVATPTTRTRSGTRTPDVSVVNSTRPTLTPTTRTRGVEKKGTLQVIQPPLQQTPISNVSIKVRVGKQQTTPTLPPQQSAVPRPTESNAKGGLALGGDSKSIGSKDDISKISGADSREITFNKLSGKTFPSLVVVARPHLRLRDISQATITSERAVLDNKVKQVLMYTPSKFTEWLIQQGMLRSDQYCNRPTHVNPDGTPFKLKLGMYSDVSRFPHSGGYVWLSDCCPNQFVSVYAGSLFEGAPHTPSTLLKLMYHWACQTNVQNVVQWVKVDNLYIKNFYTNMRAVCTQAIHQKYEKLGGTKKKIEVGVISLGTTSQDGNMRQVKVEVLGVMDHDSRMIRLRAVEPCPDDRNVKRKFIKILEPLEDWVHKDSTILTDFTVDKNTLVQMGFNNIYQVSNSAQNVKHSNVNVMEYLRRIVPRMFQNTLSHLSRQIIQQFLDELVWREMWGPTASQAFDNMILHLAEQTKLDVNETLLTRLLHMSSNPFRSWAYTSWTSIATLHKPVSVTPTSSSTPIQTARPARKRPAEIPLVTPEPAKKPAKGAKKEIERDKNLTDTIIWHMDNSTQIPLEPFYYGVIPGKQKIIDSENKNNFSVKCPVCNRKFVNNIILLKHIILHCQEIPCIVNNVYKARQCQHCLTGFNTQALLRSHLDEAHLTKMKNSIACWICEQKFIDRIELIWHMQRFHVAGELPYECGVCQYRTSSYKGVMAHFTETHDNGEHVMCPYCLKAVALSYNGTAIPENNLFFLKHIEKHQRTSLIRKCDRCCLSFIHSGILEQHLEADHVSLKADPELKPLVIANGEPVNMPAPSALIKPIPPKLTKTTRYKSSGVSVKTWTFDVQGVHEDMICFECEGTLTKLEHFYGVFDCLKCRYTTCCEKAMNEHINTFHSSLAFRFTMGKPIVFVEPMFCACGYSSMSGNRIAKHIALCNRRTAYASESAANCALKRYFECESEPQNMLNMLGLYRVTNESTTPVKKLEQEIKQQVEEEKDIQVVLESDEEPVVVKKDTSETESADIEII